MDGALSSNEARATTHVVMIERVKTTGNGSRYRAIYNGEVLVSSSRDPELDACRALRAKGLTGKAVTFRKGIGLPAMHLDIEKAAALRTNESAAVSARFGGWSPFPLHTPETDPSE